MRTAPNPEEVIRIIVWELSGALVAAGWLTDDQVAQVLDPAILGAVTALVALVWRLWRGTTQEG